MPSPTINQVHVAGPLDNISVAYVQDAEEFIATKAFHPVPVPKQSDLYYTYDKGDFLRDGAQLRGPGAESAGGGYDLDHTRNYYCPVYAYHKDVADQIRENSDAVLDDDRDATIFVTQKMLIKRELLFVNSAWGLGIWSTDRTGVPAAPGATQFLQWDAAASDPGVDIDAAKTTAKLLSGFRPNVMIVGEQVHDTLKRHTIIRDQYKYTSGANVTKSNLASYFEVDEYLVGGAIQNTAVAGAVDVIAAMYGKACLLVYRPAAPGKLIPASGYAFNWRGKGGNMPNGMQISKFRRSPEFRADRVEGEMATDFRVVATDTGVFMTTAIS